MTAPTDPVPPPEPVPGRLPEPMPVPVPSPAPLPEPMPEPIRAGIRPTRVGLLRRRRAQREAERGLAVIETWLDSL